MVHIFSEIIHWHLNKLGMDNDSIKSFEYAIEATVDLY